MEDKKKEFNYKEFELEAIKSLQGGKPLEGKDETHRTFRYLPQR